MQYKIKRIISCFCWKKFFLIAFMLFFLLTVIDIVFKTTIKRTTGSSYILDSITENIRDGSVSYIFEPEDVTVEKIQFLMSNHGKIIENGFVVFKIYNDSDNSLLDIVELEASSIKDNDFNVVDIKDFSGAGMKVRIEITCKDLGDDDKISFWTGDTAYDDSKTICNNIISPNNLVFDYEGSYKKSVYYIDYLLLASFSLVGFFVFLHEPNKMKSEGEDGE